MKNAGNIPAVTLKNNIDISYTSLWLAILKIKKKKKKCVDEEKYWRIPVGG